MGVLASGRGTNLEALLQACERGEIPGRVVVVLSNRREAPALERARRRGIPAFFVSPRLFSRREEYDLHLVGLLRRHRVELVVLAGYMRYLTPPFVEAFRHRAINIHPSLLPSFPGLEAQRQALEYGVKVSGCTVHFIDEELDHGPIILQAAVPVREDDDVESLSARILREEHRILVEAVRLFAQGRLRVEGRRVRILDRREEGGRPAGASEAIAPAVVWGEASEAADARWPVSVAPVEASAPATGGEPVAGEARPEVVEEERPPVAVPAGACGTGGSSEGSVPGAGGGSAAGGSGGGSPVAREDRLPAPGEAR